MYSCVTTLALSLIQPHINLDNLPSSASLITSNADHPMKSKFQINVQVSMPEYTVCPMSHQQCRRSKLITSNVKHTYVIKQSAEVSMWWGMRPTFNTSRNNLLQCVQKCYLHMTLMWNSVLDVKIKRIQANSSIQPLLHLCVVIRTVNLPNVSICCQWS